ncbi:MAG TPA: rhodanese-like domain-containing protein [Flavobacteriia bacterium]|nr:rhodanese-like domain-containing protein [Flavobacteriia bacterium]
MKSIQLFSFFILMFFLSCKNDKKETDTFKKNINTTEESVTTTVTPDTVSEIKKVESNTAIPTKKVAEQKTINKGDNLKEIGKKQKIIIKTAKEEIIEVEALPKNPSENVGLTTTKAITEEVVTSKPNLTPEIFHVSPTDFKNKIANGKVQLVDVRTPKEYNNERIKGAININYYEESLFKNKMATLDKSQPVYVYCRSGVRSSKSAKILKNAGFKVYDLKGGIKAWKNNHLETVK